MSRVRTVWIDARKIEQHVHVKITTGWSYGQPDRPTYERRQDHRNDAGVAGEIILQADQWLPFIRALALGGHDTGLRVCWAEHNEDRRSLWNGCHDRPCLFDTHDPVDWVRTTP